MDAFDPSASLHVANLHREVSAPMLHAAFRAFGRIHSIRIVRDWYTHQPRGYGYVNFFKLADAGVARDLMNLRVVKGRPMRVSWNDRPLRETDMTKVQDVLFRHYGAVTTGLI